MRSGPVRRFGEREEPRCRTERVTGLTIRGAKYEVENAVLRKPTTLGQSNAFVTDAALTFESGMLALVCCRLED